MINARPERVLIAAGGSGGHIFPAVALARTLRSQETAVDLMFVGSNKGLDRRIFEKEGFRFKLLSANKLSYRNKLLLPLFFAKLLLDLIRSFLIIMMYRPKVVIGFGGYVSCPVILAARCLGIPSVLHEQNVVPGRANNLLFRFVSRIAVSFRETEKYTGAYAAKVTFTGNPIRREMFRDDHAAGIRKFGLDAGKFTILVVGGSQGAHCLNETFLRALGGLESGVRATVQVIHLTGVTDYEWALQQYGSLGVDHSVHSFIDRIEEAYSASDLIVTRSGASAVFEAAFFGRPMILVPYPFAMNHQRENARVFVDRGAAIMLEEKALTDVVFRDAIAGLVGDAGRRSAMAEAARKASVPDAAERLAALVTESAQGNA